MCRPPQMEQATQIQKLSAQLKASKPAPQCSTIPNRIATDEQPGLLMRIATTESVLLCERMEILTAFMDPQHQVSKRVKR